MSEQAVRQNYINRVSSVQFSYVGLYVPGAFTSGEELKLTTLVDEVFWEELGQDKC